MQKIILSVGFFFGMAAWALGQKQTAEQIVEKYISLCADKGYLDTLRTMRFTGMLIIGDENIPLNVIKESGRILFTYIKTDSGRQGQLYLDGKGYNIVNGKKQEITDQAELDELLLQTHMLPDVMYKPLGYKMTLLKSRKEEGVQYDVVRIESPNGSVRTNFYERETGLLRIVELPGRTKVYLTEYMKHKGGLYNNKNIIKGPNGILVEMTLLAIYNNEKIDPEILKF